MAVTTIYKGAFGAGGGVTTAACVTTANAPAGSRIIVCCEDGGSGTGGSDDISSISDGTNSYAEDGTFKNGNFNVIDVWSAHAAAQLNSGSTITLNFTTATRPWVIILAVDGLDATASPIQAKTSATSNAASVNSGTITDTVGQFCLGFFDSGTSGGLTFTTTGTGWTQQDTQRDFNGAGGALIVVQYATATGSDAATGTWSGAASTNVSAILAYKLAAAGPVNTVAPAVTGTVEQTQTLTSTTGTWTGDVSSGYAYQWQRDNYGDGVYANIPGATSSTYVLTIADVDCDVRCVVTATGTGGSTAANSNAVGPVIVCPDVVSTSAPFIIVITNPAF